MTPAERLEKLENIRFTSDARRKMFGETHSSLCGSIDFLLVELDKRDEALADSNKIGEALSLFFEFDRTRGYPTGPEWIKLINKAREALGEDSDESGNSRI